MTLTEIDLTAIAIRALGAAIDYYRRCGLRSEDESSVVESTIDRLSALGMLKGAVRRPTTGVS
ncbi:MAG: hypothetical protein OEX04_00995 [Acidimicrobiia bacterium]|nr:hypothetical protein [Acidimicrobiia bacterium]MDH4306030.1 hypothetical protein [Acidimicrobiia bacterium]MDH5292150.1 hypothetical protein [Acidimicrobiia bacterium]